MAQTPNHMLKELILTFESLITCLNITGQTNKIEKEKMETHFGRECDLGELLVGDDFLESECTNHVAGSSYTSVLL